MATLPGIVIGLQLESQQFTSGIQRSTREFDNFSRNVQRSSGLMRSQFSNIGFQISDMAVQIGSGTSVLRAMTQQLPQLAAGFGPVGIAIGTVAAVGGAAATALLGFGKEASAAADETKRFADTQSALADLLDTSTAKIHDQAAAVSKLSGVTRELGLEGLALQLQQANSQIQAESTALRTTLSELQSTLLQPSANEVAGRGPIIAALAAISEAQASGNPAALTAAISGLVRQMDDPALLQFQERLVASSAAIIDLRADSEQLQKSIADVGTGAVIPTTAETAKLSDATVKAAVSTEKLAAAERSLLTLYRNDVEADRKLRSLTSMQRQTEALAKEQEQQARIAAKQSANAVLAEQALAAEKQADLLARPLETALCHIDDPEFAERATAILEGLT